MKLYKVLASNIFSLLSISIAAIILLTACGDSGANAGNASVATTLKITMDEALSPGELGNIRLETSSDISKVGGNPPSVDVARIIPSFTQKLPADKYTITSGDCPSLLPPIAQCHLVIKRNTGGSLPVIEAISFLREVMVFNNSSNHGLDNCYCTSYSRFTLSKPRFTLAAGLLDVIQIKKSSHKPPMYFSFDTASGQLLFRGALSQDCRVETIVLTSVGSIYKLVNNSSITSSSCTVGVDGVTGAAIMTAYWDEELRSPVVNGRFNITNNVISN